MKPWFIGGGCEGKFRYAFFGRIGGASEGAFASLNLGTKEGDEAGAVASNANAVMEAMGVERLFLPRQIHGDAILIAPAASGLVRGEEADAAISIERGVAVGVLTADCVPILIGDEKGRAVAAVHAGWRGVAECIGPKTVRRLGEMGIAAGDLFAAIGPAIGPCHYEVSDELAERFTAGVSGASAGVIWREAGPILDLPRIVAHQLVDTGVLPARITTMAECTFCERERYFSHRRDKGATGRQLSGIWMP